MTQEWPELFGGPFDGGRILLSRDFDTIQIGYFPDDEIFVFNGITIFVTNGREFTKKYVYKKVDNKYRWAK